MVNNLSNLVRQGDIGEIKHVINEAKLHNGWRWKGNNYVVEDATRDALLLQNKEIVQLFLEEGVDANDWAHGKGNQGFVNKLILFAAKVGSLPLVELLVAKGAKIKDTRRFGDEHDDQDAMSGAIEGGQVEIVEYLLKNGASANGSFDHTIRSFLGKAALSKNKEICELLVQYGADVHSAIELIEEKYKPYIQNYNWCIKNPTQKNEKMEIYTQKYVEYFNVIQSLLDFAQGTDLGTKEYEGLSFLRGLQHIQGFNFVGVSMGGKPVTREDLVKFGLNGADKAICTMPEIDNYREERSTALKRRLESAFQKQGRIVSPEGIVNLSPLEDAVEAGDTDTVKVRLEHGVNPNSKSYWGNTSLVVAAEKGYTEIVKALATHPLIESKSIVTAAEVAKRKHFTEISEFLSSLRSVNEKDEKGNAPIHNAIISGDENEVRRLIMRGADLTLTNKDGWSPLHLAVAPYGLQTYGYEASSNHLDILKLLLSHGVDPNNYKYCSPLYCAFKTGNLQAAKILMPLTEKKPNRDNSPWYHELISSSINKKCWRELLTLLISNGVKLDDPSLELLHGQVDSFPSFSHVSNTMFHLGMSVAGSFNADEMLKKSEQQLIDSEKESLQQEKEKICFLLQNGVNPNNKNSQGTTALHLFISNVNLNFVPGEMTWIIDQFVNYGFDLNSVDENGNTVLHIAADCGDIEATEILSQKIDINARNNNKRTPLHYAAAGKPKITEMLIKAGANPTALDINGLTPLEYSIQSCKENESRYQNPSTEREKPYLEAQTILRSKM